MLIFLFVISCTFFAGVSSFTTTDNVASSAEVQTLLNSVSESSIPYDAYSSQVSSDSISIQDSMFSSLWESSSSIDPMLVDQSEYVSSSEKSTEVWMSFSTSSEILQDILFSESLSSESLMVFVSPSASSEYSSIDDFSSDIFHNEFSSIDSTSSADSIFVPTESSESDSMLWSNEYLSSSSDSISDSSEVWMSSPTSSEISQDIRFSESLSSESLMVFVSPSASSEYSSIDDFSSDIFHNEFSSIDSTSSADSIFVPMESSESDSMLWSNEYLSSISNSDIASEIWMSSETSSEISHIELFLESSSAESLLHSSAESIFVPMESSESDSMLWSNEYLSSISNSDDSSSEIWMSSETSSEISQIELFLESSSAESLLHSSAESILMSMESSESDSMLWSSEYESSKILSTSDSDIVYSSYTTSSTMINDVYSSMADQGSSSSHTESSITESYDQGISSSTEMSPSISDIMSSEIAQDVSVSSSSEALSTDYSFTSSATSVAETSSASLLDETSSQTTSITTESTTTIGTANVENMNVTTTTSLSTTMTEATVSTTDQTTNQSVNTTEAATTSMPTTTSPPTTTTSPSTTTTSPSTTTTSPSTTTTSPSTTTTTTSTTTTSPSTTTTSPTTTTTSTTSTTTPPTTTTEFVQPRLEFVEFNSADVVPESGQLDTDDDYQTINLKKIPFQPCAISKIHVCTNGYAIMRKGRGMRAFSGLSRMPKNTRLNMIMPFGFDLYPGKGNGKMYYDVYYMGDEDPDNTKIREILYKISDVIVNNRPSSAAYMPPFTAIWALVVTFEHVESYYTTESITFQYIVATDGDSTYVVYNFESSDLIYKKGDSYKAGIGVNIEQESYRRVHKYSDKINSLSIHQFVGNTGRVGLHIYNPCPSTRVWSWSWGGRLYSWYWASNEQHCMESFANQLADIKTYRQVAEDPEFVCPCRESRTRGLLRNPMWFYPWDAWWKNHRCYIKPVTNNMYMDCCYMNGKIQNKKRNIEYAGTLVPFDIYENPRGWFYWQKVTRDKYYCCQPDLTSPWSRRRIEAPGLCDYYFNMRPTKLKECIKGQKGFAESRFAFFWGDPHIQTLDQKGYTFNGYGEYIMLNARSGTNTVTIQARTGLALDKDGIPINATVFTAFAIMNHLNNTVQAELNVDGSRDKILVYAKVNDTWQEYTNSFENDQVFSAVVGKLSLSRENQSLQVDFESGISLTFTAKQNVLDMAVSIPKGFNESAEGLLGNYNGNPDDDFQLPNGTSIFTDRNATEREIYYEFGQKWLLQNVQETSIFYYTKGKSANNYYHPTFEPIFVDEFSEQEYNDAKDTCSEGGTKEASQSCIFDLLATKDETLAIESGNSAESNANTLQLAENETPTLDGPTEYIFTLNQAASIDFTGVDDGTWNISEQTLPDSAQLTRTGDTVTLQWTPDSTDPQNISLSIVDNWGVESPDLDVEIFLCTDCSGHGTCDTNTNNTRENVTDSVNFQLLNCICDVGYEGDDCEYDIDGCIDNPCAEGQNCTDLLPADQVALNAAYNCSSCATGFREENGKCVDIHECNETANICDQICVNTAGSYICQCNPGYRRVNGQCTDVDECVLKISGCQQKCENTEGSFVCSCATGYDLNPDGQTCTLLTDYCASLNCDYTCDNNTANGQFACLCQEGYALNSNNRSCENIDECTQGICAQGCTDIIGGFNCSCFAGYKLNEDKISCDECEEDLWGIECVNNCTCSEIGTEECHPARGCVCLTGYSGSECSEDVDECTEQPDICGSDKVCSNTFGSYECSCAFGYQSDVNGNCVDIDECADLTQNNCTSDTSTCTNIPGGFKCTCNSGFVSASLFACNDIDECAQGNHGCEHSCVNNDGSFSCICEYGYTLQDDRKGCIQDQSVEDPCAGSSLGCDLTNGGCTMENNNARCFCNAGFVLTGGTQCDDKDECAVSTDNDCSQKSYCTNTEGGYTCGCAAGYQLLSDGRNCEVCDSAHWGTNCANDCACGIGGSCDSVVGCQCSTGFTGNASICTNINECTVDGTLCSGNAQSCVDTVGSYRCKCFTGYKMEGTQCQDIDECSTGTHQCEQLCTNTVGSYTCSCNTGFLLVDGTKCQDIDECAIGKHGCAHICTNTVGKYICSCNVGFKVDPADINACIVENECSSNNTCNQLCAMDASHNEICSCNSGFALNTTDNATCENINECETLAPCDGTCVDASPGYNCSCLAGKRLASDQTSCSDCEPWTYGDNCGSTCTCEQLNTVTCNAVNGTCTCKSGWTGSNCNVDIDECSQPSFSDCSDILLTCVNTDGSYRCDCIAGYTKQSDGSCTQAAVQAPNFDSKASIVRPTWLNFVTHTLLILTTLAMSTGYTYMYM